MLPPLNTAKCLTTSPRGIIKALILGMRYDLTTGMIHLGRRHVIHPTIFSASYKSLMGKWTIQLRVIGEKVQQVKTQVGEDDG